MPRASRKPPPRSPGTGGPAWGRGTAREMTRSHWSHPVLHKHRLNTCSRARRGWGLSGDQKPFPDLPRLPVQGQPKPAVTVTAQRGQGGTGAAQGAACWGVSRGLPGGECLKSGMLPAKRTRCSGQREQQIQRRPDKGHRPGGGAGEGSGRWCGLRGHQVAEDSAGHVTRAQYTR